MVLLVLDLFKGLRDDSQCSRAGTLLPLIRGDEPDSEPDVKSGSGNTSPSSEISDGGGRSKKGLVGLSGISGGTI